MDGKALLELFSQRDKAYSELTVKIAEELGFALEAIVEVLDLKDKQITWQSFEVHDPMITFVGRFGNDSRVPKLISATIPISVVEKGSKEVIVDFLKKEVERQGNVETSEHNVIEKLREVLSNSGELMDDEELIEEIPLPEIKDPATMTGETFMDYMTRNKTKIRTLH